MKKRKQRGGKRNVPSKYVAQTGKEDSQNNDWSRIGVEAQVNREKGGENSETEMIKEIGK